MDELSRGILSAKVLEACNCDVDYAIYSFALMNDNAAFINNLHNLPMLLEASMKVFADNKAYAPQSNSYFSYLKKKQEPLVNLFSRVCESIGYKGPKIFGKNKVQASLSLISAVYFETFLRPVQFFLPHSSICSGRWDFWDSIDFFALKEKSQTKKFNFEFRDKIIKSGIWNAKLDLDDFPVLIKKRLIKENLLNKKLSPESMIKAMIIRMGDMGRPFINYEVIDFSIREFFTYLGEKKYQRVDREIEFLRKLDNEIFNILKKGIETA